MSFFVPSISRPWKVPWVLALGLCLGLLGLPAKGRARGRTLLLMGKELPLYKLARSDLEETNPERLASFDLSQGVNLQDRLDREMRAGRFTQAILFGDDALSYFLEKEWRIPFRAIFLNRSHPQKVRSAPSAKEWSDLFCRLGPEPKVGVLLSPQSPRALLDEIQVELEARKGSLVRVDLGKNPREAAVGLFARCEFFLFPRDPALLSRKVAFEVLKEAYRAGVGVVAFTPKLLRSGAAAALEIDPRSAARVAFESLQGKEARLRLKIQVNRENPRVQAQKLESEESSVAP